MISILMQADRMMRVSGLVMMFLLADSYAMRQIEEQ